MSNSAIMIADDLDHWIADEPHLWHDPVRINGKIFRKLTPAIFAALRAEMARRLAIGILSAEEVRAFTAIECAVAQIMPIAGTESASNREDGIMGITEEKNCPARPAARSGGVGSFRGGGAGAFPRPPPQNL